ncbi:MAG: cell division protein SepF [Acidimicrobiales bacterium]|jgi:cell division inhibitor SepF
MATSFLKKTMVYLGLLDDEYDEYDEYDDYDDRSTRGFSAVTRQSSRGVDREDPDGNDRSTASPVGRIRTLPVDAREGRVSAPSPSNSSTGVSPRPSSIRPVASEPAKVQVVAPARFGDAKDIADCLKASRPVIVNLQLADRDLQRRMIDFCSGVTYALSGEMEKVADQVFLLAPTNVKVSDEERQRLQERGFGQD